MGHLGDEILYEIISTILAGYYLTTDYTDFHRLNQIRVIRVIGGFLTSS